VAAGFFPDGAVGFVSKHPFFCAAAAWSFLAAKFLNASALGIRAALPKGFDLVQQKTTGEKAVLSLMPRGLTFHLQTGRAVEQHHAGRVLVDILATVPARTNKTFFNVLFANGERDHTLGQSGVILQADKDRLHAVSVMAGSARVEFLTKAILTRFIRCNWSRPATNAWFEFNA
jgi:hypothetical protein